MLDKAEFWASKGQQQVAMDLFNRVLTIEPANTRALIGISKTTLEIGRITDAEAAIVRLRKIAPDDPFIPAFDAMRRRKPEEAETLIDARKFYAQGRKQDAIAKYKVLFRDGQIPPELAAEYYPLLISTLPEESVEANDALTALGALAEAHPKDMELQLANAQAMVSIEGSRSDGIEKLRELSHRPGIETRAKSIWRQALLWQGADFNSLDQLNQYLSENQSDPEIDAKLAEYRASLPSPGLRARMNGYEAIRTRNTADAEKFFQAAIDYDPRDADAVVMLAVTRQVQGRTAEWQALLDKAINLAPERKSEFLNMLGADPVTNAKAAAEAQKAIIAQYNEVERLAQAKDYKSAETLLRKLIGNQKNAGSMIQLADLQNRAGQIDAAITTLNDILALEPRNADAHLALGTLLTRKHQSEQAFHEYEQAQSSYEAAGNAKGVAAVHEARADMMRINAVAITDLAKREEALRKVWAENPLGWWVRLHLARAIYGQGRHDEALRLIHDAEAFAQSPGALSTQYGRDALQVAAIWANEQHDIEASAKWSRLMPEALRPPYMLEAISRADFANDMNAARALPVPMLAQQLLALAATPDPYGNRCEVIAQEFLKRQDIQHVNQAIANGLHNTNPPTTQQKLAYARIYIEADDITAARNLLSGLDTSSFNPGEQDGYQNAWDAITISAANNLLNAQQYQRALSILNTRLALRPGNPAMRLAADRAQISLGNANAALPDLLTLVQEASSNLPARLAAIDAATSLNQPALAERLTADGLKQTPNDLSLILLAANQARARGLNGDALMYFSRARNLAQATNVTLGATSAQ